MSRDIRFRAWDNMNKEWYSPVYMDDFWYKDESLTLKAQNICQFTGLLDKNGKEIWESDIDSKGRVVVWNKPECGWWLEKWIAKGIRQMDRLSSWNASKMEIVGNIHKSEAKDD